MEDFAKRNGKDSLWDPELNPLVSIHNLHVCVSAVMQLDPPAGCYLNGMLLLLINLCVASYQVYTVYHHALSIASIKDILKQDGSRRALIVHHCRRVFSDVQ